MQAPGGFIALQDSRLGRIRGNWHVVALDIVFMNVCRARLQHEKLEPFVAGMVRHRFFKPTVTTRARLSELSKRSWNGHWQMDEVHMAHEYWFEREGFDSNPWSLSWRSEPPR